MNNAGLVFYLVTLLMTPSPYVSNNVGIAPALELTGPDDDTFEFVEPIKIDVNVSGLIGLDNLQVRLFTGKYAAEIAQPGRFAIGRAVAGCWIFHGRIIPYAPTLNNPGIQIPPLSEGELRCSSRGVLADTECAVVVERAGDDDPFLRILTSKIGPFFAHAYYFTVKAPVGRKCEDMQSKKTSRNATNERRQAADADARPRCIEVVKTR